MHILKNLLKLHAHMAIYLKRSMFLVLIPVVESLRHPVLPVNKSMRTDYIFIVYSLLIDNLAKLVLQLDCKTKAVNFGQNTYLD